MFRSKMWFLICALILTVGCSGVPAPQPTVSPENVSNPSAARGMQAPGDDREVPKKPARITGEGSIKYQAAGPFPIDLATVPAREYDPFNKLDSGKTGGRPRSPVSDEKLAELRAESMKLAPSPMVQERPLSFLKALSSGTSFESLDYTDCCGGGGSVPPDPELAVGPNHIIAVVNVAFAIYDKSGTLLSGPTTFSSFFAGTPGCSNTGTFDPNALYDESADRFIIGIDGNGTDYCVAATTGSDPTSTWNRFAFPTDINGNFFDFPHAGVGLDAIYMGSNQFAAQFAEARVFAIEKAPLYSGGTPTIVTHSTGNDGTPQPANLHGFNQGTWPTSGPHYIMTEVFDGVTHSVWSWSDPFGADNFSKVGDVDLGAATGVPGALPIDWPQAGSSANLQGNDFRGQSTEYRNGSLWMSNTLGCNPGGGTVNCVRWAQIDPTGPTVLDAGVFGSNGEYRVFPNVSANHCDDMAIGYTKGSATTFASTYVAGRESGDPAGSLQTEVLLKAGEVTYSSFSNDPPPHRWGDYTKMTVDPDGVTFWYLGEYSKDTGAISKWGTYIGSFSFAGCSVEPQECGNGVIEGNEVCDGGDLGGETCGSQSCTGGGTLACNVTCDGFDTSSCLDCPACDNDGVCELGEDCNNCPNDCISGTVPGSVCGNGICEAGDGEDCVSCAADCNGVQGGKPSNRYCCGDGDGTNPVTCSDSRCGGPAQCTSDPVIPGSFCCGDSICDASESCSSCGLDCNLGVEICSSGVDEDCDGDIDCNDSDCSSDPSCVCTVTENPETSCGDGQDNDCDGLFDLADPDCQVCGQRNDPCSSGADCCSGSCKNNGRCR